MTDAQISVVFTGAIDEATDPRHLPLGTLVSATNGVFNQDGQLQVRYGYTMLSSPPSSVFRLAVFAFELVAITLLGACFSYSPADGFVQRDTSTPIGVTHTPLTNSSTGYNSWGMTCLNGYRVVAWTDNIDNFPRAAVYDQVTGALLISTQLSTQVSANIQVGFVGNIAMVIAADGGAANIRAFTLNTSPLGAWSGAVLLSDADYASTSGLFTAAWSATLLTIAYEHANSGNSSLKVIGYNSALTQQFDVANGLATGTSAFFGMGSRITDGENYWVYVYANNTGYANNCFFVRMNPATGASTSQNTLGFNTAGPNGAMQLASARVDSTHEIVTVSDGLNTWTLKITSAGVVGGSTVEMFHMRTVSAPVTITSLSTAVALWTDPHGANSPSYFLVDLLSSSNGAMPQLVSILAPGIVSLNAQPTVALSFPAVPWALDSAGNLEMIAPVEITTQARQGLELFTATIRPNFLDMPDVLGKEAYFSGYRYDARILVENGFAQQPAFSLTNNTTTGSTYQYAVTYGWIDSHGNLEESSPAPVASTPSAAPPNVTVTINTTGISRKHRTPLDATQGKIVLIVYRTQAIASGDPTFYRVNKEPFTLVNDPTSATVTFADTTSDATLTDGTHPVLYTVSGELNHNTPETFTDITGHMDRVWGIGADQRTIWYSQQYVDGSIPAWSVFSQTSVDDAGEPLIALADLYDKLLIFTKTKIYVVYGSGPSPAGTGNDLTTPQRIPSPSGCIDPRSIVETQQGVYFQSERGIELVGPDLSVSFIGLPVSVTTATYPVVTSAIMVEQNSVIRFTLVNTETSGNSQVGRVLNFDMRRGRWTVHQLTNGGSKGSVAAAPQSATVHPTLGYVEGHNDNPLAGIIARENTAADATPWLDYGSTFVPVSWTTGWMKAADLQGWGSIRRVLILGNYYDNHGLSFTLNFDYQSTAEVHSFSDTTIFATFGSSWEQIMLHPGIGRRCEAIQVSGTSVAPSTEAVNSGRGAAFIGLALEARPQKGSYRNVPTAARG